MNKEIQTQQIVGIHSGQNAVRWDANTECVFIVLLFSVLAVFSYRGGLLVGEGLVSVPLQV